MQNQQYGANQGGHHRNQQQQQQPQYYQQQNQNINNQQQHYGQEFQGQPNSQGYYQAAANNNFVQQPAGNQGGAGSDRGRSQRDHQSYEMQRATGQVTASNEHSYRSGASRREENKAGRHGQQVYQRPEPGGQGQPGNPQQMAYQQEEKSERSQAGKPPSRGPPQMSSHQNQGYHPEQHGYAPQQQQYQRQQQYNHPPQGNQMPLPAEHAGLNQHSNRSNTANTQHTNKTSKSSNAAGQGKNSKRSKRKTSGRLPPPKVEIQQPNFQGKNGEYSNSNSRSDYYDDSEEKAPRRGVAQPGMPGGQAPVVLDSGRGRGGPDGVAHNVSVAGPGGGAAGPDQPSFQANADSYRNESYSMIYPNQNASVDAANQSALAEGAHVPQPNANNNPHQNVAIAEQRPSLEDEGPPTVDSTAAADREFMERWGFAGGTQDDMAATDGYGDETASVQHPQAPAQPEGPGARPDGQPHEASSSQISSIRGHGTPHQQNPGPPPGHQAMQPGHNGGGRADARMGVDYSAMSGDNNLPPAVRMVDEQIRGELMGTPLNLQAIQQLDPVAAMIQQESEESEGDSDENLDDSRRRRKQRLLRKHRGGKAVKSKRDREAKAARQSKQKRSRGGRRSRGSGDSQDASHVRHNRPQGSYSGSSPSSSSGGSGDDDSLTDGDDEPSSSSEGSDDSLIFHDDPEADDGQYANAQNNQSHSNAYYGQNSGYGGGNQQRRSGAAFGDMRSDAYGNGQSRGSHLMPIQFAKEHIIKIEEDMKKMHERHVRLMREMDENYKLIEQETQEYYIEFLQKWKEVAKQKIQQYRKTTEALALEKEKMTTEKDAQVALLNEQKTTLLKDKEKLLKDHSENIQLRDAELERQKGEFQGQLRKKEEGGQKGTYRKLAQELMQVYSTMDIEQIAVLSSDQNVNASLSSETEATSISSKLTKQLDKRFKVLIQASERTPYEQYVVSSVSYLLQQIFNQNSQNDNLKEELNELKEQQNVEKEQLQLEISQLNQQNETLINQGEANIRSIGELKNIITRSQGDVAGLEQQIKDLQSKLHSKDEQILLQDTQAARQAKRMKELERQIEMVRQAQATPQQSLQSVSDANQERVQSSQSVNVRPSEQSQSSNITEQTNPASVIQKFKQPNGKIRFPTGDRQTGEATGQPAVLAARSGGFKIRSAAGNKNFVLKPSSIMGNQNFHSVQSVLQRPKNITVVPPMSEQEYNDKIAGITSNYSVKLQEIKGLKQHFQERVKDKGPSQGQANPGNPHSYDLKIFQRLTQEEATYRKNMEDETAQLKKSYDQARKHEVLAKNMATNRTSSNTSAKPYATASSDLSKVFPKQINLKNVKNKLTAGSEHPYRNKSKGADLNQSTLSNQVESSLDKIDLTGNNNAQQDEQMKHNVKYQEATDLRKYYERDDIRIKYSASEYKQILEDIDKTRADLVAQNKKASQIQYQNNEYVSNEPAADSYASTAGGSFSLAKNFHSVSSAATMLAVDSEGKAERASVQLRDQLSTLTVENTELKCKIETLGLQLKEKAGLSKELKEARASLLDLSVQNSDQRVRDQEVDATNAESYQRELDELKKQAQSKKAEYSKNLQFAKSRMDILKEQIEKLKQIVQQLRDDKTQHKGQIKSLDAVNSKMKGQLEEVRQETEGELGALRGQNVEMHDQNERLWAKYQAETLQRKRLHNIIEDMKGKIRVYCRVRPMNQNETRMGCIDAVTIIDQFTLKIRVKREQQMFRQNQIQSSNASSQSQYQEKEFVYDACFGAQTSQEEIFEDTKMLIQSGIDGFNVCIFAYGQTGSGKTYTVSGAANNMGIVPRSFMEMFSIRQRLEKDDHYTVRFECYMVELYLDKLNDLLTGGARNVNQSSINNKDKLEIREDGKTGLVYIQNAKQKTLNSFQEALDTFETGLKSRKVQSTEMNDLSSRSHLIFGIVIETKNNNTGEVSRGKLSFVDLAGSERLNKANPRNNIERQRESNAINLSLKSLGDVIQCLSNGNVSKAHIPYRDNKLTHLMKDSLGGNSKTLMFVNVSPADYNSSESDYSLRFGNRVKMIQNDVTKNVESEQVQKLKEDNELLRKKLGI